MRLMARKGQMMTDAGINLTKQKFDLKRVVSSFSHLGFKLGTLGMIHVAITVEQVTLQGLPRFLKEIMK